MRWTLVIPFAAIGALGCASTGGQPPATLDTAMMPPMRAVLRPYGGPVQGQAAVAAGTRSGQFRATINIIGSQAGQQHPWHVHAGRCDAPDNAVGGLLEYPMLDVRGDGNAAASANVSGALELGRPYHVDVHLSRANLERVIACGDLVG